MIALLVDEVCYDPGGAALDPEPRGSGRARPTSSICAQDPQGHVSSSGSAGAPCRGIGWAIGLGRRPRSLPGRSRWARHSRGGRPKPRDPAHLDAGPRSVFQLSLQAPFHGGSHRCFLALRPCPMKSITIHPGEIAQRMRQLTRPLRRPASRFVSSPSASTIEPLLTVGPAREFTSMATSASVTPMTMLRPPEGSCTRRVEHRGEVAFRPGMRAKSGHRIECTAFTFFGVGGP